MPMEFQITSSPPSTVIFSSAIALITLTIGAFFVWFAVSASNLSVSLNKSDLRIHIPIYGRSIPISNLDISSAQIVNLDESPDLRLKWRTNGIGMPGYAVGWFKLRNGEKALSAITSKQNVFYMRTTKGYSLLLSLKKPERFLVMLKEVSKN